MTDAHRIRLRRMAFIAVFGGMALAVPSADCSAANVPPENQKAIDRAVAYLRAELSNPGNAGAGGESVLAAYAMIKGGAKKNDKSVLAVVKSVLKKFDAKGKYRGIGIYDAGVNMMLLEAAAIPKGKYNPRLQAITDYIVKNQNKQGFWNYLAGDKDGDTSVTQYGALGLWAAARAGIKVPLKTWDIMAGWLIRSQIATGGWRYRPTSPSVEGESQSMTVAGASSLYVAALHLYPKKMAAIAKKQAAARKKKNRDPRVQNVDLDKAKRKKKRRKAKVKFVAKNSFKKIRGAASKGLKWSHNVAKQNGIVIGTWSMYTAYGIERLAALARIEKLGNRDWYAEGSKTLRDSQAGNGSWTGKAGRTPSTAFGILFLSKATEFIVRAETYGLGLMIGHKEGWPEFPDSTKPRKTRKLNRSEVESILDELIRRGPLKPKPIPKLVVTPITLGSRDDLADWKTEARRRKLRVMVGHPRPEVRAFGVFVLGRTGDIEHVKLFIQALEEDPDLDVAIEARNALCWISRNPRGFGLSANPKTTVPGDFSKEQKLAAFKKWRSAAVKNWRKWYLTVRPYEERDDLNETRDTSSE